MQEHLKENIIPQFIRLIDKFEKEEIEDAMISLYENMECVNEVNEIKSVFSQFDIEMDIELLTYIFEALLDEKSIVENGIVFTPKYIAFFIVKGVMDSIDEWNKDIKIIDPGCGCGIFLVAAIEYIKNRFHINTKELVCNHIYGIDLEPDNVRRCKKILKMLVELDGDDISESEINILNADSLKVDWNELFLVEGFDFIIGNPPYVNTHDMNKETIGFLKENFRTTKSGVFNIFYAFIEQGMKYLRQEGKLSFIVPNNFLTIKSALDLRNYLQSNKMIEQILDFADNMVFKPVRSYNCILILDHRENETFQYSVLERSDNIAGLLNQVEYETMSLDRLDKNGWNLVDRQTYCNLLKIENQFKPIKDFIRTGIATLKDDAYMVSKSQSGFYKEIDGIKYEIEEELVKSIYKIPELKKSDNLENVCRYIIFPYSQNEKGMEIIHEDILKSEFPKTYRYLSAVREVLDTRDKGKKNSVAWYAYGRSQGLNKFGKKLLFPTFANIPKFMLVEDETALFCNGYGIFENDYLELDVLIAVLNSKIMEYYVANTSYAIEGGYYCYQKKYIEKFSIPWFDEQEKELLRTGTKQEVDEMLVEKYGLSI